MSRRARILLSVGFCCAIIAERYLDPNLAAMIGLAINVIWLWS